ncbi:SDR family oxidoreductase [Sinimarinibacterium flocculans]|uniref:SDR family oxidoreductase n=1 Tax=Sinimarinibacterium flocculans TaxID=985250 RepID=UPI003517FA28
MTAAPVVLITGCSTGIGRALAQAFHARGCRVWATARQAQTLADLVADGLRTAALDVRDAAAIDTLRTRIETEDGGVDILVNNAGYGQMGPLLDVDAEALRAQFDTNVVALHTVTRAFVPGMIGRRRGLVVQLGSVSGVLTTPFAGAYCASKAAVHALADALRMELAPFGVQVMTVQPGAIRSEFGNSASRSLDRDAAADSLYAAVADGIAARANASQEHAMPAATLARRIADAALRPQPPARLRAGGGARLLPLLAAVVPQRLRDRLLLRRFGLDRLRH